MIKNIFGKTKERELLIPKMPLFINGFILFVVFLFTFILLYQQPTKVLATIPSYNSQDSCGLINIDFASTGPSCSVFSTASNNTCYNPSGNPTNPNITTQTLTVYLSSNTGNAHQVSYWTANSFCTNGYLSSADGWCSCADNAIITNQIVTVPANKSVPITVTRSSTTGAACGSYQLDFSILAVDGNTSCNSGNTNNNVGGSLTCETGINCSAVPTPTPTPPPNCSTTPTNCSVCAAPANTCSNGNGTQTCTLSQPQTCNPVTVTQSCTLNNCTNGNVCTNQVCKPPTYTVSGNIFNDYNKNGLIDNGEANYSASPSITASTGTVTVNANGTYTISNILAGPVTVSYISLPAGYYMTSPLNGPPSSFVVTVGNNCNVNGSPGATCNAGNITNVNFGITNTHPWLQADCGDIREDNGITDLLPAGASALISTPSCPTSSGLPFTGNTNPNFGSGQSSTANQLVGGIVYPEVYSQSSTFDTSYTSLLGKAQSSGVATANLASVCTLSNCTLPANLPHGIYVATGNVNLNAYTFPANQNYIILVNGNLTINGKISVPIGSTALFSTSSNITISPNVGTTANVTTSSLDGWYIAGGSFILPSAGNCSDIRLNIGGSVIVNSMGTGGTFQNNRDLCGGDTTDPTISFVPRLDMVLNTPEFLKKEQTLSQEVAP